MQIKRKVARLFTVFLLIFTVGLINAQEFTPWNFIRNSAYTAEDKIHIRCQLTPMPEANTRLFHYQDGSWQAHNLEHINGQTHETIIQGDRDSILYCRYHTTVPNMFADFDDFLPGLPDSMVIMMPGFLHDYPDDYSLDKLAKTASDPIGDIDADMPDYLDITGSYFSYSEERLYTCMTNNYDSFPTGRIIGPYNIYTTLLINPETVVTDTLFYGLVYAQVPAILTPGLYRFSGTDFSAIRRIADIDYSIIDNQLHMSCSLEDLISDPYFGEWPNMTNSLISLPMTIRTGLDLEFRFVDTGALSVQNFNNFYVKPYRNRPPDLSNLQIETASGYTNVRVDYYDPDGNFPIISQLVFDEDGEVEMFPLRYDYSETVTFTAVFSEREFSGKLMFSDDGSHIVTKGAELSADDESKVIPQGKVSVFPNPVNFSEGHTSLQITSHCKTFEKIKIYNIRGQIIKEIDSRDESNIYWNGLDSYNEPAPTGIYLLKGISPGDNTVEKIMLIR